VHQRNTPESLRKRNSGVILSGALRSILILDRSPITFHGVRPWKPSARGRHRRTPDSRWSCRRRTTPAEDSTDGRHRSPRAALPALADPSDQLHRLAPEAPPAPAVLRPLEALPVLVRRGVRLYPEVPVLHPDPLAPEALPAQAILLAPLLPRVPEPLPVPVRRLLQVLLVPHPNLPVPEALGTPEAQSARQTHAAPEDPLTQSDRAIPEAPSYPEAPEVQSDPLFQSAQEARSIRPNPAALEAPSARPCLRVLAAQSDRPIPLVLEVPSFPPALEDPLGPSFQLIRQALSDLEAPAIPPYPPARSFPQAPSDPGDPSYQRAP